MKSRHLFFSGLVLWGILRLFFSVTALEKGLYDLQVGLLADIGIEAKPAPELVLSAIDRRAFQQGIREEHLDEIASSLGPNAINITNGELSKFFQVDPDGVLRCARLYLKTDEGIELSPIFKHFLAFRDFKEEELKISSDSVEGPGWKIPTDSEGQFYPHFIRVDVQQYEAPRPLRSFFQQEPREEQGAVEMAYLEPTSLVDLLSDPVSLENRLVLLGKHLTEAGELEYPSPLGDMTRLELHGNLLSSLLTQSYFEPLGLMVECPLSIGFLFLLVVLLRGRRTVDALGLWLFWSAAWLGCHSLLFYHFYFAHQSSVLWAGAFILVLHLLSRSWRVSSLLRGLGGRAPLQSEGEMEATILFTNLPEALKEMEDASSSLAQDARAAHARCVADQVNKHDGRLVDLQGDALMIAFGLEGSLNHRQQAAACAADIVERVNYLLDHPQDSDQTAAHCGLVTGTVAVGKVGGGQYRGVAAVGDTTNSAARLLGRAMKLDQAILLSDETRKGLGPRADTEEIGQLEVKGKSEAIKVWALNSYQAPPLAPTQRDNTRAVKLSKGLFALCLLLSFALAKVLSVLLPFSSLLLDSVTRSNQTSPIIFAGLDEESLEHWDWPWPRSLHAQAAQNCFRSGARLVFLDFLFEDKSEEFEDDQLLDAVLEYPSLLLAAAAQSDGRGIPIEPILLPGFLESEQWGLINHAPKNRGSQMRYGLWELPLGEGGTPGQGIVQRMLVELEPQLVPDLKGQNDFLIRWGPLPETVSYHRLLNSEDPIFKDMEGKVVIVGDNLKGRSDAFETPAGLLKGAVIHALSLQTMWGQEIIHEVEDSVWVLLLCLSFAALLLWISWRLHGVGGQLTLMFAGVAIAYLVTLVLATAGYFIGALLCLVVPTTVVLGWLLHVFEVNKALTNYIPRQLRDRLEKDGEVGDLLTEGTVLVTDIRGYTSLAEGRSPAEVLQLLNHYHEKSAKIYESHGGHLLTYQGDAQIVLFGPLEPLESPVKSAVESALQLPKVLQAVAESANLEPGQLRVGAGVTTGEVTVSLRGGQGQLQYSVFGAPVRRAHDLQSLSDDLKANVILDARSYWSVLDQHKFEKHEVERVGVVFTIDET